MQKQLPSKLKWVERTSKLMDEQFTIPGTGFKFGIDPILNLFPFVGDLAGFAVSAALVLTMAKNGVSKKVLILMGLNIVLDATIGAIPIIGQVFDFVYKANSKNIKLLKEHYEEGRHQGSGKGIVVGMIIVFLVLLLGLLFLLWKLFSWLWGGIF